MTEQIRPSSDITAHLADTTDAHDASAISVLDTANNFTGTEVETVLDELFDAISAGGIPATIFDAKGDLIAATAADTAVRLPAGDNNAALIVKSSTSTGLKWRANNDFASAAPTVNDDEGDTYETGSRWLDTSNGREYVCTDPTTGAAVWVDLIGAGGAVATDAIWDAAGDLAVGSGADTAARLAIGASNTHLISDGATALWRSNTFGVVDASSALASGTGDVTITGSLQDLTGATLSLEAGTYIISGTFDVLVNSALNDRTFEGHLDSGGSDQNDVALLVALGLVNDRFTVAQTWRLVLASTTTVKLRGQYSGGTAGDFTSKGANTTIAAYRAGGGGGGATAETWETVVADLSGKVHRWKFEESSGTNVNDEISTLDLTLTGSVSLVAASPLGNAVSFTGGYAESSGLGSIPVGDTARTVLAVWKKTALGTSANLPIISYGTATTRTMFQLYGTSIAVLAGNYFTDLFNVGVGQVMDGNWHMSALMNGTTRIQAGYHDGQASGQTGGANLNTSAANNFHVAAEYDDTDPAAITVTDVIVFDRMLTKAELDRLWSALRVLLDGS